MLVAFLLAWCCSRAMPRCNPSQFVDNQADCDNTLAEYAAALKEFLGLKHVARACRAGRRVRQFWAQQEVQLQHLKMIMNLGGFNDSNKVEVWDAIVKRRGHRNLDWFLCFGKIFAFYVCGWCLSCCLMCWACVVLCAFVFRVCVSWLNVSKWNHELWMNVSVVR